MVSHRLIKKIKSRSKSEWADDILLLVMIVILAGLYFILNVPTSSVHNLKTTIDDQIPRLAIFAIPYILYFPLLWGTIFYSWYKNRSFKHLALAIIVVNLVAFVTYIFFQTNVPRQPVIEDGLLSDLLRFIYSKDQPYNCFPSLHSALSTVVATYFVCRKSKWAWVFICAAILVIISTLFVKQHYIVDAISGLVLGAVTTKIIFSLFDYKK